MAHFLWQGTSLEGTSLEGAEERESAEELEQHLNQQGVFQVQSWNIPDADVFGSLSERQVLEWLVHLGQLLASHLRLADALGLMAEAYPPLAVRYRLRRMRESLHQGTRFSETLARFGGMPPFVVQLIRVAEAADRLPQVVDDLTGFYRFQHEMAREQQKVLSYPLLVLALFLGVTLGLVVLIIPMFERLYLRFGEDLFWGTWGLLKLSELLREHPVSALLALGGVLTGAAGVWHRWRWEALWSLLPGGGTLLRESRIMFYCTGMELLLRSGVQLQEALPLVARILPPALSQPLKEVEQAIHSGKRTSEAFQQVPWSEPTLVRMLHLAEESGALTEGFRQFGVQLRERVQGRLNRINILLGPLVLLLVALGVLGVLLSVYLPLFQASRYY